MVRPKYKPDTPRDNGDLELILKVTEPSRVPLLQSYIAAHGDRARAEIVELLKHGPERTRRQDDIGKLFPLFALIFMIICLPRKQASPGFSKTQQSIDEYLDSHDDPAFAPYLAGAIGDTNGSMAVMQQKHLTKMLPFWVETPDRAITEIQRRNMYSHLMSSTADVRYITTVIDYATRFRDTLAAGYVSRMLSEVPEGGLKSAIRYQALSCIDMLNRLIAQRVESQSLLRGSSQTQLSDLLKPATGSSPSCRDDLLRPAPD